MNPPADIFIEHDPIPCPVCGREACEDHLPPDACPVCGRDGCEDHLSEPPINGAAPQTDRHAEQVAGAAERERVRREALRLVEAEERPPRTIPPFITLANRLKLERPTVTHRIRGWWPHRAKIMLSAQFKSGKTVVVGNIVRSLLDGDLFLGVADVVPVQRRIVIIDTEMTEWQLDDWLDGQAITNADRLIPVAIRGNVACFNPLDAGSRSEWIARLREYEADVLVLDCLRPVLDALGLDEHRDAGKFLVPFDALAAEAGISEVVAIHHMGHTNERARGDSRLRDWPDVEWRLVRENDDPSSPRFISAFGRDVDVRESRLIYDHGTRHLTLAEGNRKEQKARGALDAVLVALADEADGLSGRGVVDALADSDHPRASIEEALKLGVREGVLLKRRGNRNAQLYRLSVPVSRSVP